MHNGPGNSSDWLGLYNAGASNTSYLNWTYVSGNTTYAWQFSLPASPGDYEVRLLANGGYTDIATSTVISVFSGATDRPLDASRTSAETGEQVSVTVDTLVTSGNSLVLPTQLFSYDANGNRTVFTEDGMPYAYTSQANSNRILSTAGPQAKTYSYDAAGNITGDGTHTYAYDDRGRLTSVNATLATYQHNGQGQRVKKVAGSTTLFAYDEAGNLIGEYDSLGNPIKEHVWFNGAPVAVIDGTDLHYVHTDQLGTPRAVTDGNTVIWRWYSDAFGSTAADEDPDGDLTGFTYNLRFPGQYYDDETGLHYNYFRTYDPSTGRYMESDPIGVTRDYSGLLTSHAIPVDSRLPEIYEPSLNHTYSYAAANPVTAIDPLGLDSLKARVFSAIGRGDVKQLQHLLDAISDPKLKAAAQQAIKKFQTRADDWIAQNCRGSINREFPEHLRDKTLEEIRNGTTKDHKKAWKLLNDKRFKKP